MSHPSSFCQSMIPSSKRYTARLRGPSTASNAVMVIPEVTAFSPERYSATILILIGGLVNASLATLARNKRKGEEQPYA